MNLEKMNKTIMNKNWLIELNQIKKKSIGLIVNKTLRTDHVMVHFQT